ncbi:MAG: cysteine desulfurase [Oscillospiraceae bacterium]|nr:cysteine desulfurase [Oscillospiraceae bacterium]MBQ6902337.1 cysteine desulfurase [Oscillospiraceae bacterium]
MIYLDNASTTRVIPEAAEAAVFAMCEDFGNPSSLHTLGFRAEKLVSDARKALASVLSCDTKEITFTSCGSESNNLAIFGSAARAGKKKHMITTSFEHPSVLNAAKKLEAQGFEVTYVAPREDGSVHAEDVADAVRDDTFLVSVMSVNNEIGSVMDIPAISRAVKAKNREALIHTDAVQAFLKIPINTAKYGADIISISGHKVHAPKGIGAIYIKRGVGLTPQIVGGGQEQGLRSGTEATSQIAAFAKAVESVSGSYLQNAENMRSLLKKLSDGLTALSGVHVFSPESSAPHILTAAFPKYPSEVIMRILEESGIYVSAGSACSKGKKSHVLRAVKFPDKYIGSAVRISLSRFSSKEDIASFLACVKEKLI